MKNILFKILLISVGLFAALLVSEKVSEWYLEKSKLEEKLKYVQNRLENYRYSYVGAYDKDLGWGFRPEAKDRLVTSDFDMIYSINSKGIRDKDIPFNKPKGEFRIAALGESTVFGEGINYSKRFSEVIEQALRNVEVINMGVRGFGMDQSFLQLKRNGFKYRPDLAVLFVMDDFMQRCKDFERFGVFKPRFVLNDTKDELIFQDLDFISNHFTNTPHLKKSSVKNTEKRNKRINILKNSKLCALVSSYKEMKEIDNKLAHNDKSYWDDIRKTISEGRRKEDYSEDDFNRLIFLILKNYQNICREQKVNFLIVYIDDRKPAVNIKGFCNELNIPYLDLSGILANTGKLESLRFEIDPHFNEFAHKVIGEYTSGYLKNKYHLEMDDNFVYHYLKEFQ